MAATVAHALERERVEALYQRYGRVVLARLYGVCLDRDLALEATQEAFLKLQGQSAHVKEPLPWLVHAGRNWLIDVARRQRRQKNSAIEFDALADTVYCPQNAAMTVELRKQVADAMAQLDADDREMLAMRYVLDWPSSRIGEAMGISAPAVDMRMSRARSRLAKILGSIGVGHEVV